MIRQSRGKDGAHAEQLRALREAKVTRRTATPPKTPPVPPAKKETTTMKTPVNSKSSGPAKKKAGARRTAKASKRATTKSKGKTAASRKNARTAVSEATARPGVKPGSKGEIMLKMVLRPEGATEAAICKELGWQKCRVTLKRTCEKVGATLTSAGKGEYRVYRAEMPEGAPSIAPASPA